MAKIQLSVALVTRNRPHSLAETLTDLSRQTLHPFEVIVSDDSDAEHAVQVRALVEKFGHRYISGPRRSLYANRNFSATHCLGTHIRTMDDDHRFPPDHLEASMQQLQSAPECIWTTGERSFYQDHLVAESSWANQLHPAGVGNVPSDPEHNWAISDGSTFYPRQVFERGFRMVERFGFSQCYLEYGAILFKNGFVSRGLHGVMIEHHSPVPFDRTMTLQHELSKVFCSICFNVFFQPSIIRCIRYLVPAVLRSPNRWWLCRNLPQAFALARTRWVKRHWSLS